MPPNLNDKKNGLKETLDGALKIYNSYRGKGVMQSGSYKNWEVFIFLLISFALGVVVMLPGRLEMIRGRYVDCISEHFLEENAHWYCHKLLFNWYHL